MNRQTRDKIIDWSVAILAGIAYGLLMTAFIDKALK